jgi:preprotein translocase subunit SecY
VSVSFWEKTKIALRDKTLRNRFLFLIGALLVFRLLSAIPVPGVNTFQLQAFLSNNQFFGLLSIFSGGGLSQLSIAMLGVGAYITATIIMQLLTVLVPRLKSMYHEEGEIGRKQFVQYSRLLTLPIAFIQGFSLLVLLTRQGILEPLGPVAMVAGLMVIVGGAMFMMWLGELMTEFGIGNGVSLLIFAGIVATLPTQVSQLVFTYDSSQLLIYVGFVIAAVAIIAGVVVITEAERAVPITYARQSRDGRNYGGTSTYLPLRLNQAGVMPIIFALSILLFPQMLANFFVDSTIPWLQTTSAAVLQFLNIGWLYAAVYFLLVFGFTYFYTSITFDPEAVAENLQKGGAFIPGIRPGDSTIDYLAKIVSRITFLGAIFLSIIAVLPIILQTLTGVQSFAIGGTALLIVVAVVIDLYKKVDAQITMRQY